MFNTSLCFRLQLSYHNGEGERFAVKDKNSFRDLVVVVEDSIKQMGKKWLELRIYLSEESSLPWNSLAKGL